MLKQPAIARALFLLILVVSPASADTVQLQSGKTYQNVRLLYGGSLVIVVFRSGKVERIPVDRVRSTSFKAVAWEQGKLKAKVQTLTRQLFRMAAIERERRSALWRAAIWPGWGHYHSRMYARGMWFSFAFGALFSEYNRAAADVRVLQAEYDEVALPFFLAQSGPAGILASQMRFDNLKHKMHRARSRGNRFFLMALAVWGLGIYDVFSKLVPERAFEVTVRPGHRSDSPWGQRAAWQVSGSVEVQF